MKQEERETYHVLIKRKIELNKLLQEVNDKIQSLIVNVKIIINQMSLNNMAEFGPLLIELTC